MVWKKFELSKLSGILGIFFIGCGWSISTTSQVISIIAKLAVNVTATKSALFLTTMILAIASFIFYISGILILALNSKTAESESISDEDTAIRLRVTLLVIGSIILSGLIGIVNGIMPA
ncbi:MAG: hypothetical protein ACFFC7_32795 [Candidatus Hermodarchaeota archaeon]